jgi:hypothetical protein
MGIDSKGTRYFDRYVLVAQRALTARGALWDAYDEVAAEELAIEVIAREYAHRADIWAQLQREHQLSERIAHSNVLVVHPPQRTDGVVLLPMQLAANGDVGGLAAEPYSVLLPVLIDVAEALRHAHSLGIAHLALSARHVLVDAGHCALLSGFEFDGGSPAEFDAAVRKDLRDFAMLTVELLEGPQGSQRRELPPRLRAMCDAIYESTFTSRPVSFATIAEELEFALHDTAPLSDDSDTAAYVLPSVRPRSPNEMTASASEQAALAVDLEKLELQPAPTTETVAIVSPPTTPSAARAEPDESAVRESRPDSRRAQRVRREALAWRWLASVVALTICASALYLGQRNDSRVVASAAQAPTRAVAVVEPAAGALAKPRATPAVAQRVPPAVPQAQVAATPPPAPSRVAALIESGNAALNEFDGRAARQAFAAALRLDANSTAAQRGLRRVPLLSGVRSLADDARRAEVAGDLTRAAQGYSHAVTLDREHAVPQLGLRRIRREARAQPDLLRLIDAHIALGAGRLDAAERAFQALAARPDADPRARDGLAQAQAALLAKRVAPQMRSAALLERAQDWAAAMRIYDTLLSSHPDYIPARQGRQRVIARAADAGAPASANATAAATPY